MLLIEASLSEFGLANLKSITTPGILEDQPMSRQWFLNEMEVLLQGFVRSYTEGQRSHGANHVDKHSSVKTGAPSCQVAVSAGRFGRARVASRLPGQPQPDVENTPEMGGGSLKSLGPPLEVMAITVSSCFTPSLRHVN